MTTVAYYLMLFTAAALLSISYAVEAIGDYSARIFEWLAQRVEERLPKAPPTSRHTYICDQCGKEDESMHFIQCAKHDDGYKQLCNYCHTWREAVHTTIKNQ